jgi:hypothetical protein
MPEQLGAESAQANQACRQGHECEKNGDEIGRHMMPRPGTGIEGHGLKGEITV